MYYSNVLLISCVALLSAVQSIPLPAHADAADSKEYFDVVVPEVTGGEANLRDQPAGLLAASDLSREGEKKQPKTVKKAKTVKKSKTTPVIPAKVEAAKMRRAVQVALKMANKTPKIVTHPRRAMRNAMMRQLIMHKLGMRKVAHKSFLTKVIRKQSELEQKPEWLDFTARKIPTNPLLQWRKHVNSNAKVAVKSFERVVRSQGKRLKEELERSAAEDSLLEIMEAQS